VAELDLPVYPVAVAVAPDPFSSEVSGGRHHILLSNGVFPILELLIKRKNCSGFYVTGVTPE